MRVRANGAELEVRVDGPPASRPLLLLNSLGADLTMWDLVTPAVSERRRVVRYDMRGHGRSPVVDGPCPVEVLAADALGVLDALGLPRADLCGLSLGAMVAATVAAQAPDRVGALVLCNTTARMAHADVYAARAAAVRAGGADGMAAVAEAVLERWFTPAFRAAQPREVERARAMVRATPPEGYAAACEAVGAVDLREVLPRVRARTLVVVGSEDHATPPAEGERVAALVRGARLRSVPAAHLSSLEAAEALAAILLSFLAEGA